jgi:predicted transcriptional regulator
VAYKLTPLGSERALRTDRAKDPETAVLALLYEQKDALEAYEVAGETNMSEEAAERVLRRLVSKGYVKEV